MKTEIINIDALRSPSRKLQFLGREFEVGYIPSGVAIPLIEQYNALLGKQKGGQSNAENMKDSIAFVAFFCSYFDASMSSDRIAAEAVKDMVETMFTEIIRAILVNAAKFKPDAESGSGSDEKKK